jgi:UDP-N-acetylmuramate dehydrogenase
LTLTYLLQNRSITFVGVHIITYIMPLVQENVSLKPYNSFGISVNANLFVDLKTEEELQILLSSGQTKQQELLILGGGSNILFTKDFPGLVIKMSITGITHQTESEETIVTAGAGVVWNDLVIYCVSNGFAGMENLTLIPGTVGASPIQNIGAYGVELKDVFHSCKAFNIETGASKVFTFEDCHFGYRESSFKKELKGQYIISSVNFRLNKSAVLNTTYGAIEAELLARKISTPTIADVSSVVAAIRVSKLPDPSTIGNAGSFFKNPIISVEEYETIADSFPDMVNYPVGTGHVKLAAGWLIEQCGFKGKVVGQTGTWKNQALVLVNHGAATGQEVYSFSERIIDTVYNKFSVKLEREVNII